MFKKIKSDANLYSILVLIFLSIIWGSSFILIKKGLIAFSPIQVGAIRVFFASIILLPFAVKNYKKYFSKYKYLFLIFAVLSNLSPAILFALAESEISSSLAGILNALTPIFTFIVGALFFGTEKRINQIFGLILGIFGSVLLIVVGSSGEIGEINYFSLFVVLATLFYGISANIVKRFFQDVHPIALTSLAFMTLIPISIIILITTDTFSVLQNNESAYESLFFLFILGVVGTAFALILFNKVIQTTSAVFASTVTYLIPIVAVMWGVIDNEPIFLIHIIGMIVIIVGIYFVNYKK